jgi:uncharacterized repeat protein (TIGR04002 family)
MAHTASHRRIVRTLTLTAVFSALIFLATAYLPRIPFPGGYIHVGDAFIYLAAVLLPTPWACAAGAVGAGLADLVTGYVIWAPGTIFIKAMMAAMFTSKRERLLCPRNFAAVVPAGAICVLGYYLYEAILTRSFAAPAASVWFNLIQAAASAVIYFILLTASDAAGLKQRLNIKIN